MVMERAKNTKTKQSHACLTSAVNFTHQIFIRREENRQQQQVQTLSIEENLHKMENDMVSFCELETDARMEP